MGCSLPSPHASCLSFPTAAVLGLGMGDANLAALRAARSSPAGA